jgi:tRNA-splicing ligase RtcB
MPYRHRQRAGQASGQKLPDRDLAHFVKGTPEFAAYWHDLQWSQDYARYNRDVMVARVKRILEQTLDGGKPFKPEMQVNCHHNYAEQEVHYGESVYVTRKGAVRARDQRTTALSLAPWGRSLSL